MVLATEQVQLCNAQRSSGVPHGSARTASEETAFPSRMNAHELECPSPWQYTELNLLTAMFI